MDFYTELETKVKSIKNDGAVYGRQIKEDGFLLPSIEKLKSSTQIFASQFANLFHANIDNDYKKFQQMESDIAIKKYQLDKSVKELSDAKKDQQQEQDFFEKRAEDRKDEIEELRKKIKLNEDSMEQIEQEYVKSETEGDLYRISIYIFITIMAIVGVAELFIYQSVFLSQEIGIMADLETENERKMVKYMAMVMGTGFIVMITWLAHETGKRLRHLQGTYKQFRYKQWLILLFINFIVVAALVSTVILRADMHQITAKDAKITTMYDASESAGGLTVDGDEDEDEAEDVNEEDKNIIQTLKDEITESKSKDSWFFAIINAFIYLGGVMLAYHTHTSSVKYEHLESLIARERKRLQKFEERKTKILHDLKNYSNIGKVGFFKKLFSKKRETHRVDYYEKNLMQPLKEYTDIVNAYDALAEEIYAKANAIKNSYIEAVHSYLYELSNYISMESTLHDNTSFSNIELEATITKVAKLDKYITLRQEAKNEVIHIDNIDEFINSIQCTENK